MKVEKYDIISLKGGRRYTISEILDYNNNKYLHLMEVDENEEILDDVKIAKMVKTSDNIYGIEEVTDTEELETVRDIFSGMIEADYS